VGDEKFCDAAKTLERGPHKQDDTENGDSDGQRHLYVGRTNRLRQRLQNHCRPSGTHFTATFAFRIARQDTGRVKATYSKAGSREALTSDPEFAEAFEGAKRRVAKMDIRSYFGGCG